MEFPVAVAYLVSATIAAYLVGAIPIGLVLGRQLKGIDIREQGSGKIGATNVYRSLGLAAAVATLLGDIAKGAVGVVIARLALSPLGGDIAPYGEMAGALAAVAGHNWPIYIGWRGGRGVATALGAAIVLAPLPAAIALPAAVILILATDMASVGSLGGMVIWLVAFSLLVAAGRQSPVYGIFALVASVLLVVQHRDNIGRLLRGEERRLGLRTRLRRHSAQDPA